MEFESKPPEPGARGRRRSSESHQAILQAAVEVLKRDGYRALTIEAIAAQAGVGKTTIYRWWASKAEVVLEALITYVDMHIPFVNTGWLRNDLTDYFERSFAALQGEANTSVRGLIAEAQFDPAFMGEFQRVFVEPRREALIALLTQAKARGELGEACDVEVLADMIFGAKWYRFLLRPAPLDREFAASLVDMALHICAAS